MQDLRHLGHQKSEAGRRGADLPRLAHAHARYSIRTIQNNVYIYVSGTSFVRPDEELAGCSGGQNRTRTRTPRFQHRRDQGACRRRRRTQDRLEPADLYGPAHRRDQRPEQRRHARTRASRRRPTSATTSPFIRRSVSRPEPAQGNGILLDIKDPANPKRIDAVNDPNYSYWHSASFSNDGKKVVFTDEWGGGLGARCRAERPEHMGRRLRSFTSTDNKLTFAELLQDAGRTGRHRELRCSQRLAHSRPRPRHHGPGLVSGRRFGDGFHRPEQSARRSHTSTAARSIRSCSCSAATGRPIGTTATSTRPRSRAASTSLN